MEHLFAKSDILANGDARIPAKLVARWQRQIATCYAQLSESEKDSDRHEADRIISLLGEHGMAANEAAGESHRV